MATDSLCAAFGSEQRVEGSPAVPSTSSSWRPHLRSPGRLFVRSGHRTIRLNLAGGTGLGLGTRTTTADTTTTTGCCSRNSSTTLWPPFRSFASQAHAQAHSQPEAAPSQAAAPHSPPPPQPPPPPQEQQQHPPPRPPNDVLYYGPLSQQHKLLKRISIANTVVAAAAAPAIVAFADNISLVSRYGLAASLVFFGLATTGALHWVANPYVHELKYDAATGTIDVRTTTLLGSSRWHSFNVDDVRPLPWNRPVATFTALNRFYYIDVYSFPDQQLLRRLTPDEADVPKGYKDKEDDDDD